MAGTLKKGKWLGIRRLTEDDYFDFYARPAKSIFLFLSLIS